MKLKLKHLQSIVKDALYEAKSIDALKNETKRVLGPIMNVEVGMIELAESINDRLDVIELTGRQRGQFKTSVVTKFMKHKNSEVRAMSARLLPENIINSMINDKSPKVRHVIARRAKLNVVKEMMRKFPNDEEIRIIYSQRKIDLTEASNNENEFEMYAEEALGDASKTYDDDDDLSDVWYTNKAREIYSDYAHHNEIDVNWGRVINGFCDSTKATSHVEINKKKLHSALKELIKEKEDKLIGESKYDRFDFEILKENSHETVFPVIEETIDPVRDILNETNTNQIERIKTLFNITEGAISNDVKRYFAGEPISTTVVPVSATLPHRHGIRHMDERVIDMFVESWNLKQIHKKEPFELSWVQDPQEFNKISFKVSIR